MIKGIVDKNGKNCCGKCKREIVNYGNADVNYCSYCGNPLNEVSIKLFEEEIRSIKLETVKEIIEIVKTPKEQILIADYSKRI